MILNDLLLTAGDVFLLEWEVVNPLGPFQARQAIVLDVWGSYYFWPTWTQEVGWGYRGFNPRSQTTQTILEFEWPAGAGSGDNIIFWAALLAENSWDVIGQVDFQAFSFR